VLKEGITHISSLHSNKQFVQIGDSSLISARNTFLMPNGKTLGDYIPFYFGVRTPMLYVIQRGGSFTARSNPGNIVYCITTVAKIIEHKIDFVFTDGHAVDSFTTFYLPSDIDKVDEILDKEAIKSKYWKDENDLDKKRRKEAEFLAASDIPYSAISGFAVYNDFVKEKMVALGVPAPKIKVVPDFYF
jgi:hypothetical protein